MKHVFQLFCFIIIMIITLFGIQKAVFPSLLPSFFLPFLPLNKTVPRHFTYKAQFYTMQLFAREHLHKMQSLCQVKGPVRVPKYYLLLLHLLFITKTKIIASLYHTQQLSPIHFKKSIVEVNEQVAAILIVLLSLLP